MNSYIKLMYSVKRTLQCRNNYSSIIKKCNCTSFNFWNTENLHYAYLFYHSFIHLYIQFINSDLTKFINITYINEINLNLAHNYSVAIHFQQATTTSNIYSITGGKNQGNDMTFSVSKKIVSWDETCTLTGYININWHW